MLKLGLITAEYNIRKEEECAWYRVSRILPSVKKTAVLSELYEEMKQDYLLETQRLEEYLATKSYLPERRYWLFVVLALTLGLLGIHHMYARHLVKGVIQFLFYPIIIWLFPPFILLLYSTVVMEAILIRKDGNGKNLI